MLSADYRAFMGGDMPAWLQRLQTKVEGTIARHALFRAGDAVMAGVSGGKDSLCLLLLLALCRRRPSLAIRLEAAIVDWMEYPMGREAMEGLGALCDALDLPLRVLPAPFPREGGDKPGCYPCARKRKELVFSEARSRGCRIVAFGHHLDDAASTAFLNLMERGRIEGMPVSREFFSGRVSLVRPLIEVPEASLATAARRLGLPVASIACPRRGDNARDTLKPLMRELRGRFPRSRDYLAGLGL